MQAFIVPKRQARAVIDQQWCTIKSASAIQESVSQSADNIGKGFVNSDGISSYANAVMQCLLLSPAIRQAMQQGTSKALKDICAAYTSLAECNLDCLQLRQELGAPYSGPHVQSAVEFLQTVVHHSPQLSCVLQQNVKLHIQCSHCNRANFTEQQQHILPLSIPTSLKSCKFSELWKMHMDWTESADKFCNMCGHPVQERTEIIDAKNVLIMQMDVWSTVDGNVIKRKTNIASIPDSSIKICSHTYKLMSAVSLLSSNRPSCHYIAILSIKGKKWLHFNDLSSSVSPWPRGGKDVVMLFYHITSTVTPKDHEKRHTGPRTAEPSRSRTVFARAFKTSITTSVLATITTTTATTTCTTAGKSMPTMATGSSPTVKETVSTATASTASSVGASDTTSGGTTLTFIHCKGFANNDGVSCYANSILQCLLQHNSVRNACVGSRYTELHDLVNSYVDHTKMGYLSSRSIRRLLGAPFSVNSQQDAAEFLEALAIFCTPIRNCLDYTIRTYLRCSNCIYTSSRDESNIILPLVIPPGSTSVRLNELLSNLGSWETMVGSHCSTCNADGAVYQTRQELFTASELLVVQLKVYVFRDDGSPQKLRISVRDATSSSIDVRGHRYKVQNIVSHHGPSMLSGHYTSYHKQNRGWMLVNDCHLTRMSKPQTSSDVYIVLYAKQPAGDQ